MSATKDLYLRQLHPMEGQIGHPETETAENRDSATDATASAPLKTHPNQLPLFRTGDAK